MSTDVAIGGLHHWFSTEGTGRAMAQCTSLAPSFSTNIVQAEDPSYPGKGFGRILQDLRRWRRTFYKQCTKRFASQA